MRGAARRSWSRGERATSYATCEPRSPRARGRGPGRRRPEAGHGSSDQVHWRAGARSRTAVSETTRGARPRTRARRRSSGTSTTASPELDPGLRTTRRAIAATPSWGAGGSPSWVVGLAIVVIRSGRSGCWSSAPSRGGRPRGPGSGCSGRAPVGDPGRSCSSAATSLVQHGAAAESSRRLTGALVYVLLPAVLPAVWTAATSAVALGSDRQREQGRGRRVRPTYGRCHSISSTSTAGALHLDHRLGRADRDGLGAGRSVGDQAERARQRLGATEPHLARVELGRDLERRRPRRARGRWTTRRPDRRPRAGRACASGLVGLAAQPPAGGLLGAERPGVASGPASPRRPAVRPRGPAYQPARSAPGAGDSGLPFGVAGDDRVPRPLVHAADVIDQVGARSSPGRTARRRPGRPRRWCG